jgi:hypothetical protein
MQFRPRDVVNRPCSCPDEAVDGLEALRSVGINGKPSSTCFTPSAISVLISAARVSSRTNSPTRDSSHGRITSSTWRLRASSIIGLRSSSVASARSVASRSAASFSTRSRAASSSRWADFTALPSTSPRSAAAARCRCASSDALAAARRLGQFRDDQRNAVEIAVCIGCAGKHDDRPDKLLKHAAVFPP